jgi:hypothetical protein
VRTEIRFNAVVEYSQIFLVLLAEVFVALFLSTDDNGLTSLNFLLREIKVFLV